MEVRKKGVPVLTDGPRVRFVTRKHGVHVKGRSFATPSGDVEKKEVGSRKGP